MINIGLLNGIVYPSIEKVVSQLKNVTEDDSGEYTCSVPGNSTTATLTVVLEGNKFIQQCLSSPSIIIMQTARTTQEECNCGNALH